MASREKEKASTANNMGARPNKIFLDSNVILSGLISDRGAPKILLDLLCLRLPFFKGATGRYNLIEIERNLRKKLPAALTVYAKVRKKLNLEIVPIPELVELNKCTVAIAEKDLPVLVSALRCKADYLVTGDQKDFGHLRKGHSLPLRIVSPSEAVHTMGTLMVTSPIDLQVSRLMRTHHFVKCGKGISGRCLREHPMGATCSPLELASIPA
jgi:predicted nucleic acid-binding protein